MSCNSAGLPLSFNRFREIQQIDFEFRQDRNHLPVPAALFVKEQRTGVELGPFNREQLLAMRRAPFDTGPDVRCQLLIAPSCPVSWCSVGRYRAI
jgi:hypothetical protein